MELWLNNVGIIKDSSVRLDGLTVITGKNSSGKTTVGKVLYAIIQANSDIEEAFERSKSFYLSTQFNKVWMALTARRSYSFRSQSGAPGLTEKEQVLFFLARRGNRSASLDKMIDMLYQIREVLAGLTAKELTVFLEKGFSVYERDREYVQTLSRQFEERRANAIAICDLAANTINDEGAFSIFRRDRMRAFLNHIFHGQIKPVRAPKTVARVRMLEGDRTILGIRIRSKTNFEFSKDGSFVFPFNRAIFIDDPFILDHMSLEDEYFYDLLFNDTVEDEGAIGTVGIMTHGEHLSRLLSDKGTVNFFDDLEFQRKYRDIIEKINQIVPGEFQESGDGMFYVERGTRLNVQNLATGSKLFFILKLLFMSGYLNEETVLVLDEPESHLHPEWINKFAEILVLLIKEARLHILLTTHSPNLLLALDVYARAYATSELSHFYLAKTEEGGWETRLYCIDGNVNEGYAHLSIPLIEMTLQQDHLNGE